METSNILIVGGGIVGLATAYNFLHLYPDKHLIILEKEYELASHQSGHNSGVMHSGIYYPQDSKKLRLCQIGKKALQDFCQQENIPYEICGKVIVATNERELQNLYRIAERGKKNGVKCEVIDHQRLLEIEPHVNGNKAICVYESGIVDYRLVCLRLAEIIKHYGHQILTGEEVVGLREDARGVSVQTRTRTIYVDFLINCAGLHSDRIAAMGGAKLQTKIIPFRGEYFKLAPSAQHLCRHLIYPVPDVRFPFLGVHFTRMIDGSVECGPNAVFAFSREGYRLQDISGKDLLESLTYSGFLRLVGQYWHTGLGEMWRSLNKTAFAKALQRLIPEITADDLVTAPAGVRAQAVTRDGCLLDDFAFHETRRMVHIINAPSPAATASLGIGRFVAERVAIRFS